MRVGAPLPSSSVLVTAMPLSYRPVLARTASLGGRHRVVTGDAEEHPPGEPLEDVNDEQEHLKNQDEQHRPCDLERAALKPEGEPLQAEHDDPEGIVHPGPHNLGCPDREDRTRGR